MMYQFLKNNRDLAVTNLSQFGYGYLNVVSKDKTILTIKQYLLEVGDRYTAYIWEELVYMLRLYGQYLLTVDNIYFLVIFRGDY